MNAPGTEGSRRLAKAPGACWRGWVPDSEDIKALPQAVRQYVHDLFTLADPGGEVAELACLRETVAALEIRLQELEADKQG